MFILAIDQSTSATKAMLFDLQGRLVHRCSLKHRQYYPQPGWVEHDAEEIYSNTQAAIGQVLREAGIAQAEIAAVGITNQRETALVWDRNTGRPIHRAVVWQCRRAAPLCEQLWEQGWADRIRDKTGLVLSPYFSAPKIKWILDNVEGARKKADNGELLFGTMDSWLLWKLTNGNVHATDYSNACRTMLFNIRDLKWDNELLELFGIPQYMMPDVRFSDEVFGQTASGGAFDREIPIAGFIGDSHAALFAQNCFSPGMAKVTYGTGSSIMMNIGASPLESRSGLVTSLAWGVGGKVDYVLEGNINCTGDTIQWLVENLQILPDAKAASAIASSVESSAGVYLVPAFVGLGAPYWDTKARASVTGITRDAGKAHIIRAAEESIAYQVKDVLDKMVAESGVRLGEIRVDGGPTRDSFLMQFQADMLDVDVESCRIEELSAIGAAFLAGLAVGAWKSRDEIAALRSVERVYHSGMDGETRDTLYQGWKEAVRRTLSAD